MHSSHDHWLRPPYLPGEGSWVSVSTAAAFDDDLPGERFGFSGDKRLLNMVSSSVMSILSAVAVRLGLRFFASGDPGPYANVD
jgi:hypothetical protein